MFNHILANSGTTGPFYCEKQIICEKRQLPCLENKMRACAGKSYALPHLFSRKILWCLMAPTLNQFMGWYALRTSVFLSFFNLFFFNFIGELVFVLLQWECDELKLMWWVVEFSEQFMKMLMCSFLQLTPRSPRSILYPISVLSDDEALISMWRGH